jgi:signal transduction histidine kinase
MIEWIYTAQIAKGEMLSMLHKDQQKMLDFYLDMFQKKTLSNGATSGLKTNLAVSCGNAFIQMNRPREALYYLRLACEFYESDVNPNLQPLMSLAYASFTEAYAMLHQTDSAEYFIKKAGEAPFIIDEVRIAHYKARIALETAKGNYRSALESFKKYHLLSDSIAKAGKTTEIARMKNWRELEQKDNENEILQQEHLKQHRLILILSGALVMIVVLLALSVILYKKTAEKNRELKKLHTVKDKLFSVIAHDLRSPMGALISILKMANNNMLDTEMQASLLRDISMRVNDTYGLLENLLHWSKSQMKGMAPAPAYFDVQNEILAVLDGLRSLTATKMIALNARIDQQQVYADRDMFAVVVRNLTMNAIKYTPTEGKITIESELSDNKLVISVKDTGTGMPQEIQEKLFKLSETRSQRGTNNESGTGLGLVLCADFVKINGGSIWFNSKQGEGSTFSFSVPVKGN